jgi:hypothetical protein
MPSVVAQIRQEGAVMVDYDPNRAHGGKTVYGACVGILMLETRFPRIPGDIGHAVTWPFPVLYKVVRGATGERVTTAKTNDRSTGLLDAFLAALPSWCKTAPTGSPRAAAFCRSINASLLLIAECRSPRPR